MLLRSNFSPFPQYFHYTFVIKGVYLHIHLLNLVVQFVFSSIMKICYVEVRISRSISKGPFKFEITRVDCISLLCLLTWQCDQHSLARTSPVSNIFSWFQGCSSHCSSTVCSFIFWFSICHVFASFFISFYFN